MNNARRSGRRRAEPVRAEHLLEQHVAERTGELTALLEVSRSLTSTLALEPLLDLILNQLLRVIDYRSAGIFLARGDALETVAMRDTRDPTRDRSQVGYRTPLAQRLAVWQAVLDGEPVVIGDVRRDDDAFARAWRTPSIDEPSPTQSPVRAWMAVPLSARGQVFGMLALTRDVPDSFTDRDTELALAFAGHAAVAIDNARLLGESEQRTSELAALLAVSRSLSSTLDLEPLLDVVLAQMQTVAEYDGASVVVLEDNQLRTLRRRATARASTIPGPPEDVPIERAAVWWRIVASGSAVILDDAHADEPLAEAYRAMVGVPWAQSRMYYVRSWMAAPLALQDRVIGAVILAHGDPHRYTQRHADLAVAIATQAAVAIENARLYERERRTAQELATLLDVARGAASTLELEPLLNNILDTLELVVDYDGASIGVVDGDDFRFLEARGASSADRRPEMIGVRLPMRDRSGLWEPLFRQEPVIIADVRDDTVAAQAFRRTVGEYFESRAMRDVRSFMIIPLVNRDRLVGLLTMSSRERDSFTARHAGLALAIATHIGAALENARLYNQTDQRARELTTLLEVSHSLSSTLELKPLIELILDQLQVVADYTSSSILMIDGEDMVQLSFRWPGIPADQVPEQRIPLDAWAPIWEAVRRRESVIVADVRGDSPAARAYQQAVGERLQTSLRYVHSWMAVPITRKDGVIGMITLSKDTPDFYTPRHAGLATAIASQAAMAIENARLLADVERRSRELTALLGAAESLAATLDLEQLLDVILEQIQVVAESDSAGISTLENGRIRIIRRRAPTPIEPTNEQVLGVDPILAGAIWTQLQRGEPVIIGDVRGDEPLARAYRDIHSVPIDTAHLSYVRSWMAVPLLVKDRMIGFIGVSRGEPGAYAAHHAQLVLALATQAAAAIENARLYAQVEQRARELATLLEVSHTVTSTLKLGPLLDLILEQFKAVVDYRGATLGTIDGDELLIIASRAVTPERSADRGLRFTLRRFGPIWEAIRQGEPVVIADVRSDEPAAVEYRALNATSMDGPTHRDIRSWMAVPLMLGERVIGMLTASQDVPDYFTAHHADLAMAVANQAAIAMENARLYGEAQGKAALEERQRLARELHDSVSQALFGIALGAGAARRRLDLDPAKVGESLDYVLSLADTALTEMRALIFELRPETLEKEGLVAALTRHAAATQARHEIAVETMLCEEPAVPLATKEALYRIAQEAMHNAAKYARGTRIELTLARDPEYLVLEVRDDGIGFDPSQDFAGHLGLHSMRERMAAIGGTTDITSAPGQGTCIRAAVPSR